ncbi:hypothetical protein GF367_00895 [Candidatus Woesearchaeota archaeon]|nr:hypothetical protein [Candidatus Woesearchaeota archaeon]
MVVLGLGLGLVRGLFAKGQQSLVKVIDNNMLENQATYDTPFTVDRNVEVKIGKSAPVFMGIYNKEGTEATYEVEDASCRRQGETSDSDQITVVFPSEVSVPDGEAIGLRGSIYVVPGAESGAFICSVKATSGNSQGPTYTSSVFVNAVGG